MSCRGCFCVSQVDNYATVAEVFIVSFIWSQSKAHFDILFHATQSTMYAILLLYYSLIHRRMKSCLMSNRHRAFYLHYFSSFHCYCGRIDTTDNCIIMTVNHSQFIRCVRRALQPENVEQKRKDWKCKNRVFIIRRVAMFSFIHCWTGTLSMAHLQLEAWLCSFSTAKCKTRREIKETNERWSFRLICRSAKTNYFAKQKKTCEKANQEITSFVSSSVYPLA